MHHKVLVLALIALAFACAAPAFAQTTQGSLYFEELTWPEIGDAIKAGKTTIIIPTGGIEDKGPHMAVSAHSVTVHYTAGEIAKRLGNALVAPTLSFVPEGDVNPPSGHMRMMGTITLPEEPFGKVVEWECRSLQVHGFKNMMLLADSGGNVKPLQAVAGRLNKEWADSGVHVYYISDYYGSTPAFNEWLMKQGQTKEAIGQQAGISQTSEILVVAPQLLRKDKFAMGGAREMEGSGVTGDPRRASVAYGKQGLEMKIDAAVKQIKTLIAAK